MLWSSCGVAWPGPMADRLLQIQVTKALLVLTEAGLTGLLAKDPDLWRRAIRRGKWEKRARAAEARESERR